MIKRHLQSVDSSPSHARSRWKGPQRRIGLTGGIASGKSSVGHWLEKRAIPVLDADHYARDILSPGSQEWAATLNHFGPSVTTWEEGSKEPTIDRQALAKIIFQNKKEREWLEQLVHPSVGQRFETALQTHAEEPIVVLMVPLLFEAGLEALCSEIWVVHCSAEQQLKRLMQRNNLTETMARQRIQAQWPLSDKCRLGDVLIDNSGAPHDWENRVSKLL